MTSEEHAEFLLELHLPPLDEKQTAKVRDQLHYYRDVVVSRVLDLVSELYPDLPRTQVEYLLNERWGTGSR